MKKLMILAAVAATAFAAAAEPLDPKTATEAEVRAVIAEMLSQPDKGSAFRAAGTNNLWKTLDGDRFASLRAEADDALAAKGFGIFWNRVSSWPKSSELARAANGANAAYARTVAAAKRLGADMCAWKFRTSGCTLDDLVAMMEEYVAVPQKCSVNIVDFDVLKRNIQALALRSVKKYMRSQGKSFITKDGVNPCEAYMTSLTAALNAPRFAGLDAWLKGIGMRGIDLSAMPSAAEIAQLKSDVLDGAVDMDDRIKTMLYICLGVEGYNAFVKEYNGD